MKVNLKKLVTGTLIVGALLTAEAYISYVVTDYEVTNKEDTKQEEVNINTVEEEEPQTEPTKPNTNTAYVNQDAQQPIQTSPLTIDDIIVLDTDPSDNTLEVAYTVTNNTDKYINRIDFHIYCVDTNGNRLTDTFVQVNVDLEPNTSNDILSKGILIPAANNYSYVVVEATDFRF